MDNIKELCLICQCSVFHNEEVSASFKNISTPVTLLKELQMHFIFQHVLELPLEQLESCMRTCSSLSDCVRICKACSTSYVENCVRIFMELAEVKRRFITARMKLIEAIKRSVSEEFKPVEKVEHDKLDDSSITSQIRQFTSKYDYEVPAGKPKNPFIDGDLMATEKLKSWTMDISPSNKLSRKEKTAKTPVLLVLIKKNLEPEVEPVSSSYIIKEDVELGTEDKLTDNDTFVDDEDNRCSDSDWDEDNPTNPVKAKEEDDQMEMTQNSSKHQNNDLKHRCSIKGCKKRFSDKTLLEKHEQRHRNESVECSICGKLLMIGHGILARHVRTMHKAESQNQNTNQFPFPCDLCPETFLNKVSFLYHKRKVHGITTLPRKSIQCSECDEHFFIQKKLADHLKTVHEHEQVFPCAKVNCKSVFVTAEGLQGHVIEVHEKGRADIDKEAEQCCEKCGKVFENFRRLGQHKRNSCFRPLKIHPCPIEGCDKTFRFNAPLQRHILFRHEGKRECQCDLCGIYCTRPGDLWRHMRVVHEEREREKNFKCETCGNCYARVEYLIKHQNRKGVRCVKKKEVLPRKRECGRKRRKRMTEKNLKRMEKEKRKKGWKMTKPWNKK